MTHATAVPSTPSGAPRSTSILTPVVDFLCVGGLSILVLLPLLLTRNDLELVDVSVILWAQLIVNYAHFMASYRIVYRDREMILKHKWATIWVPLFMVACLVGAIVEARGGSQFLLAVFFMVASGYLAWHYTGQTWGMMVAFNHLQGNRFDRTEYWLIRGGLRILLCWHLAWFLRTTLRDPGPVEVIYQVASAASVLAAVTGLIGLVRLRTRTGRWPGFRVVVAWASIFVWYAAVARWGLKGLFLVQFAHALQYLEFPARMEINRAARRDPAGTPKHMLIYGGAMLAVTLIISLFVPGPTKAIAARLVGAGPDSVAPVLISYFIGIHHFFTDGVIWKLRNPDVQADLFGHARPVVATTPVPPVWWERRFWIRR